MFQFVLIFYIDIIRCAIVGLYYFVNYVKLFLCVSYVPVVWESKKLCGNSFLLKLVMIKISDSEIKLFNFYQVLITDKNFIN